jgi:hypothetical protein
VLFFFLILSTLKCNVNFAFQRVDEQMTRGAVLFMKGLTKETTIDNIKEYFGQFGTVAWVEYAKGDEKVCMMCV